MEKLLELLNKIRPDLDFTVEQNLVDDNRLDSFDIITIVSEINDVFNVDITVADLEPHNLNSMAAMWNLILHLKK